MKKICREVDLNQGSLDYYADAPEGMAKGGFTISQLIIDEMIQILIHSKVAKVESYLIDGYYNE